jgi:hypothetical protein
VTASFELYQEPAYNFLAKVFIPEKYGDDGVDRNFS